MQVCWGVDIEVHRLLIVYERDHSGRLGAAAALSPGKVSGITCTGDSMGPTSTLDAVLEKGNSSPVENEILMPRGSSPRRSRCTERATQI
jgi:hypothetical protein